MKSIILSIRILLISFNIYADDNNYFEVSNQFGFKIPAECQIEYRFPNLNKSLQQNSAIMYSEYGRLRLNSSSKIINYIIFLRPKEDYEFDEIKIISKINEPTIANPKFGSGDIYEIIKTKSNIIFENEIVTIKKIASSWGSEWSNNIIAYNIRFKNSHYYDESIIEFIDVFPDNFDFMEKSSIDVITLPYDNIMKSIYLIKNDNIYFSVNDNNVILRKTPEEGENIIRTLRRNEELKLEYIGKEVKDNKSEKWILITTTENEKGWVIGKYLKRRKS